MAHDISPTTGETYYSGTWVGVKEVLRVMNIGEGKLAKVTEEMCNHFQERVDRMVDDMLAQTYHVPILAINRVEPDGSTKRVFPGSLADAALYWSASLLLLTEFQGLSQNLTEQANSYVDRSRRQVYAVVAFNHRLRGQELRSNISHTLPPTMQPAKLPEANF
jgi:hypothetical protein